MANLDAERALLGGLLIDGSALWRVLELIDANDLSLDAHRRLFRAIEESIRAGDKSDIVAITAILKHNGDLEHVGGRAVLAELLEAVPSAANITTYAKLIRVESIRDRGQIEAANLYSELPTTEDPEKTIFEHQHNLGEICGARQVEDDMASAVQGTMPYIESLQKGVRPGYSFGREFKKLDSLTFGIQPELYVIAARPSQGKTSLIDQIAENLEGQGLIPLVFSLETSREALTRRRIYRKIGKVIDNFDEKMILHNQIDPVLIARAADEVSRGTTRIYDSSVRDAHKVSSIIRARRLSGLPIAFIVDHLQLMNFSKMKNENLTDAIGRVMSEFKSIVQDLKVPGFVLSQLSRASVKENREPNLSDLRSSGDIEQDADVVIFINRPYDKIIRKESPEGDIIVGKNRNGHLGRVRICFDGPSLTFTERDDTDYGNGVESGHGHPNYQD